MVASVADRPVFPAPAKLNLFLHVTGQRPDGYHTLQTLFQFLDFGDELTFEPTTDGVIRRRGALTGVPEERDLTVRAARALQAHARAGAGVVIELRKRLPLGGGLGGGSSDAATTLIALNRLWGTGLHRDELAALGLVLGADVPVFVRGQAAFAEGVGEVLTPVAPEEAWYLVVVPRVAVSTAEVFAEHARRRNAGLTVFSPIITIRGFRADPWGPGLRNDLEPLVCARYPEVARALDWAKAQGRARMTGSGACVFLAVADEAAGQRLQRAAAAVGLEGFVARGMNRHPLATDP